MNTLYIKNKFDNLKNTLITYAQNKWDEEKSQLVSQSQVSLYCKKLFIINFIGIMLVIFCIYGYTDHSYAQFKQKESVHKMYILSSNLLSQALLFKSFEKEFVNYQKSINAAMVQEQSGLSLRMIDEMRQTSHDVAMYGVINKMAAKLQQYIQQFSLLTLKINKLGLHNKDGLDNDLKNSAYIIEGYLNENGLAELLQVFLMIRTYEKDFMHSSRDQYLIEVAKGIDEIERLVDSTNFSSQSKNTVFDLIEQYRKNFNDLSALTLEIKSDYADLDKVYDEFSMALGQINDYFSDSIKSQHSKDLSELESDRWIIVLLSCVWFIINGLYSIALLRKIEDQE